MTTTKKISEKNLQVIEKHLKAFNFNYKSILIEKCIYSKRFLIFWNDEVNEFKNNYIQSFSNILEVNGWLYGMVQGKYFKEYQI